MNQAARWLAASMTLALGCGQGGSSPEADGAAGEGDSDLGSAGASESGRAPQQAGGSGGSGGEPATRGGDGGAADSTAGSGIAGNAAAGRRTGGGAGGDPSAGGNGGGGAESVGGGAGTGGDPAAGGSGGGAGQLAGSGGTAGSDDPAAIPTGTPDPDEIRINETVRFQTVDGIGANAYNFPYAEDQGWVWADVQFVHTELQIHYIRTAPWFVFWEPSNDDADPDTVNWDAFGTDNMPLWHDLPYATYLGDQGVEVLPGIWDAEDWLASGTPRTIAPEMYPELGESIATYLSWLLQNGVQVPVAEVQNEPTIEASIQYPSPEALRDAALAVLDQLDQHGLSDVLLHGPNVHAPLPAEAWARVWLEDSRLRSRTAAVSYHTWWDDDLDLYAGIRQVAEEYGKPVWATEVGFCALATGCFGGANYLLPETWGTAWDYAMSYYRAFAWSHASRAYHWSLLGHDAVVSETGECTPSFYVLKHFANYIVPGACRLEAVSGDGEVLALAFLLPDGTATAILINQGSSQKTLRLSSVLGAQWAPQDAITTSEGAHEAQTEASGPVGSPAQVQLTVPAESVTSLRLAGP